MSAQESVAEKNRSHWNTVAESYESADPAGIKIAEDAADVMLKKYLFDENSTSVLEFACGTGVVSRRLAPRCLSVTGVDISENMIDRYNKSVVDTPYQNKMKGYVFDLLKTEEGTDEDPLKDRLFDVVVCAQAYHHLEDVTDATNKLAKYLKPSGCLFIVDNTWFKWNTSAEVPGDGPGHAAHHHHHHHHHHHDGHHFKHEGSEEEQKRLRTLYDAAMDTVTNKEGFSESNVKALFESAGLTEDFDFTILGQYDRAQMSSEAFVAGAKKPSA